MFLSRLSESEKSSFYRLAYGLIALNGIEEAEEAMIQAAAQEMALPEAPKPTDLDIKMECAAFASNASKKIALLELSLLAHADGSFQTEERSMVKDIVTALQLDQEVVGRASEWAEAVVSLLRTAHRMIEQN